MTNYKLNEEKMFADVTDGVAIIINSDTGVYYGMNSFGTAVFENLINGVSTEKLLNELKKIPNISPEISTRFENFISDLVEKELLIPSNENSDAQVNINANIALGDESNLSINEYNDAQELLLADPIHEVREETGWLPEKNALNPDQEDVARREAKISE
jgi:hypothetical protein